MVLAICENSESYYGSTPAGQTGVYYVWGLFQTWNEAVEEIEAAGGYNVLGHSNQFALNHEEHILLLEVQMGVASNSNAYIATGQHINECGNSAVNWPICWNMGEYW